MKTVKVKLKDSLYFGNNKELFEVVVPIGFNSFLRDDNLVLDARKVRAETIVNNGFWFIQDGINVFVSPNEISFITWED